MPTIPPEPLRQTDIQPHQAREVAESFGTDAERYDRTRPRYPEDLVERIVAASPGRDVLDVGCGTGIAARLFQAAGCRVLGVEPDPRMADFARRAGAESGIEVEVAKFEDWDPAGRQFDAVVSGQAWHWVDPVAGAAAAARVLRPGGRLAVFWNAFDPAPDVAEAFLAVYRRELPESPIARVGAASTGSYETMCATADEGLRQTGAFGDSEQWRFGWDRLYTRDEWLEQVPTFGGHNLIPPAELERLLAGLGAAIDDMGGSFTVHYVAMVLTAARK
jgi:SAM-dependent methyltransferase